MKEEQSFDRLLEKVESKYELVVAAAKRARVLTENSNADKDLQSQKPVTVALEEIAREKLLIERPQQQKKLK
ncbi:MAG TPA: DNA-directed RNA polymerase subunit omega [Syntrophomonadaceae bacterium]|nr:DNA-directed RNA polymerase subunit omega [Syntrophomonadaceae bacterium]